MVTYIDTMVFGTIILTFASSIYVKAEFWMKHVKSNGGKKTSYLFRKVQYYGNLAIRIIVFEFTCKCFNFKIVFMSS